MRLFAGAPAADSMTAFRNRFLFVSVIWLCITVLAVFPLSRLASVFLLVGGTASLVLQLARIQSMRVAVNPGNCLDLMLKILGVLRWPVCVSVFYIAYRLCGRADSLVGAAGGLLIPLAATVYTGMTGIDSDNPGR